MLQLRWRTGETSCIKDPDERFLGLVQHTFDDTDWLVSVSVKLLCVSPAVRAEVFGIKTGWRDVVYSNTFLWLTDRRRDIKVGMTDGEWSDSRTNTLK